MNMRKLRASLALITGALLASMAVASDQWNTRLEGYKTSKENPVVVSVQSGYQSNSVTDNGVAYDDASWRSDLAIDVPWGIRFGATMINGIGSDDPFTDEKRLFAEKTFFFCDVADLTVGFRHEFLYDGFGDWDIDAPYVELGKNFSFMENDLLMRAYVRAEYWHASATDDNGLIPEIGLRALLKLSSRFSLDLRFSALNDPGIQGGNGGIITRGEGYINYDVTEDGLARFFAGGEVYNPWGTDGPVDVREKQGLFKAGFKVDDIGAVGSKIYNRIKGEAQ